MATHAKEVGTDFIAAAEACARDAMTNFGGLTAEQLNWKPGADRWSIAQCLDHLMTANAAYFPTLEALIRGEKHQTFWEKLPVLPTIWGNLLVKSVAPESARKLKAPKIFQPSSSTIPGDIVQRFADQQDRLIQYLNATEGLDWNRIIITSPVSKFITYSLMDTYRIIFGHEQRHLNQARRVLEASTSEPPAQAG